MKMPQALRRLSDFLALCALVRPELDVDRLAALAGISLDEFLYRVDTRNLIETFPGRAEKGDLFPVAEARARAEVIKAEEGGREVLVFVGRGVADAFGFDEPLCTWRRIAIPRRALARIPHPAGTNLWWNDAANVDLVSRFLRELLALGD